MNYFPKVVHGEPSLPAFFRNATFNYERALLPRGYTVNIEVNHKIIGYAIFRGEYWCGYCHVPDIFYNAAREFDKNIGREFGKNEGDWNDFFLNQIPEITYFARNQSIIGWDHAHLGDEVSYTNLAGVLAEIWSVWKLCGGC